MNAHPYWSDWRLFRLLASKKTGLRDTILEGKVERACGANLPKGDASIEWLKRVILP